MSMVVDTDFVGTVSLKIIRVTAEISFPFLVEREMQIFLVWHLKFNTSGFNKWQGAVKRCGGMFAGIFQ
jgi:hypothetical protein